MQPYRVTGKFQMGREYQPFTVETVGDDETAASERVLSTLGSRHRINRRQIKITAVTAIKREDVTDAIVEKRISMVN